MPFHRIPLATLSAVVAGRENESAPLGANRILYAQVGLLYQRGSSRGRVIPLHMGKSSRKRSALQGGGKLRAMASKVGADVSEE